MKRPKAADADPAQDCVFHSDRYVFDEFVRDLRAARLLKRRHAKVMAMTVCTCRKKASYRQAISQQQVQEAADYLLSDPVPTTTLHTHPTGAQDLDLDQQPGLSPSTSSCLLISQHGIIGNSGASVHGRQPLTSQCSLTFRFQDRAQPFLDRLSCRLSRELVTSSARFAAQHSSSSSSSNSISISTSSSSSGGGGMDGGSGGGCQPVTTSQCRLTVLLYQVLRGDFTLLEEEEAATVVGSSVKSRVKAVETETTTTKKKLSRDTVRKILAKKKKNPKYGVRSTLTLPMFGGSVKQLLADPRVGVGFSALRRRLSSSQPCCGSGIVLEIDYEATATKMSANEATTVAKVWSETPEVEFQAWKVLVEVASDIQKKNANRWHCVLEQRKIQRQYFRAQQFHVHNIVNSSKQPQLDYKLTLTEDFEKKALKKQRDDGRTHTNRPSQRDDGSSIAHGHCLHCLLPFQDFKAHRQRDSDVKKRCRHHPGFVTGGKWTCCLSDSESQHPTHEEHAQNGCCEGRQHSFRPHKKSARGVGAKAYRYERNFRKKRLTLSPHTSRPLIY